MEQVILVGFMGVGKTSVGQSLAKALHARFIDLDEYIQEKEGLSIERIFKEKGEEYFRTRESLCLKELLKLENSVLSTGGGIITRKENVELLEKENAVVFLDGSLSTIYNRIKEDKNRPLGNNKSISEIKELLHQRYSSYEKVSKYKILVDNKNIEEITEEILDFIL